MNPRHESDIRTALDARLSGIVPEKDTAQRILTRAYSAPHVHGKLTVVPILVLFLLMILGVAACATFSFGLLDFMPERAKDEHYIASISRIDAHFENDFMTLSVNEAAFDGTQLDLTMDIRHKDGAGIVYVIPSIQAQSGSKFLSVAPFMLNFTWEEGFFLPEQQPLHLETEQAGVGFILCDPPQSNIVEWTLQFDILRPLFPIQINEKSLDPQEGEEEIPFDVYIQDYISAYENETILLTDDGRLFMYDGALSMGAAFGENPWNREGLAQRMIALGVFERIETMTVQFTTRHK